MVNSNNGLHNQPAANDPLTTLVIQLDPETMEHMNDAIELEVSLMRTDNHSDKFLEVKDQLHYVLEEVGLTTVWAYQEALLNTVAAS